MIALTKHDCFVLYIRTLGCHPGPFCAMDYFQNYYSDTINRLYWENLGSLYSSLQRTHLHVATLVEYCMQMLGSFLYHVYIVSSVGQKFD